MLNTAPTLQSIRAYTDAVRAQYDSGQATEHSYRPALQTLLQSAARHLQAVNEPKRRGYQGFAPDFVVRRDAVPLGLIEAKDIPVDLDRMNAHDRGQFALYQKSARNFIQTNHLTFRHYVDGVLRGEATIGALTGSKLQFDEAGYDTLIALLETFADTTCRPLPAQIHTPELTPVSFRFA